MNTDLRLALIQSDLAWQDAASNRRLLEDKLKPLAQQCDLIILPEMFTSAFNTGVGAIAEEHPGPTLDWMRQQAGQLNAAITGSIAVTEAGKRYNRLLFVTPQGSISYYDKRHLFRMLGEDKRYSAGSDKLIIEYKGWRILPLVCYDLRFPVWCRYTAQQAYDLMLFVANWPAPRSPQWQTLLQARAIENQCYVAGVNRVGTDGNGLSYDGHSAVINPQGQHLLQADTADTVVSTTISLQSLLSWRKDFPAWQDADPFTLS